MTIEEQIAQLEAMRETLLPLEQSAREEIEPLRAVIAEKRYALHKVEAQIEAITAAVTILRNYLESK